MGVIQIADLMLDHCFNEAYYKEASFNCDGIKIQFERMQPRVSHRIVSDFDNITARRHRRHID